MVDLSILKIEDRRWMVHRVSIPLLEQISTDDAQMVLELPCRVSAEYDKQGGEI